MTFEVFLCGLIIFTPLIVVFTADGGALLVDSAAAISLQELATVVDQQKPSILILIYLYVLMGNLPEQGLEVILATWGINLLGEVTAAFAPLAETALVLAGDFDLLCHIHVDCNDFMQDPQGFRGSVGDLFGFLGSLE